MRFSIFQLVALATSAGALWAVFVLSQDSEITWQTRWLRYQPPQPSANFNVEFQDDRVPLLPQTRFDHGYDLFEKAHRAGWQARRYHFYRGLDAPHSISLPMKEIRGVCLSERDTATAASLAYGAGYLQCQQQIDELLLRNSIGELKSKIAIARADSELPYALLAIASLVLFAISFSCSKPSTSVGRNN